MPYIKAKARFFIISQSPDRDRVGSGSVSVDELCGRKGKKKKKNGEKFFALLKQDVGKSSYFLFSLTGDYINKKPASS